MDTTTSKVNGNLEILLEAVEAASPVEAVEVLARQLAEMVGAKDVSFLITDFSGDALIRFLTMGNGLLVSEDTNPDHLERVPLSGSVYDKAIRSQQPWVEDSGVNARIYVPVSDRGDALGILEMELPSSPTEQTVQFIASAAHALAYVIIANRRHTDLFERGQRNAPFSLAAEIQRRLLPPAFTCEAAQFSVAGWLEPASEVGGDTFDYSVERSLLHLSMSDAMGHTIKAAQLATLAVGSLRNSRRANADVVEQARAANEAICTNADGEEYVSGLIMRIDMRTGILTAVNAGHPLPYLVRDGVATQMDFEVSLPFGMLPDSVYREQSIQLQPGDRLVLFTDGMLERNASSLDFVAALKEMTELHPREVVHNFARAVIGATGGDLQDDATVMCVDWYGKQVNGGRRVSNAGASQDRASDPVA